MGHTNTKKQTRKGQKTSEGIVEGDARDGLLVADKLALDLAGGEAPELGGVVRRAGEEVLAVAVERAVPHPALVPRERAPQAEAPLLVALLFPSMLPSPIC